MAPHEHVVAGCIDGAHASGAPAKLIITAHQLTGCVFGAVAHAPVPSVPLNVASAVSITIVINNHLKAKVAN